MGWGPQNEFTSFSQGPVPFSQFSPDQLLENNGGMHLHGSGQPIWQGSWDGMPNISPGHNGDFNRHPNDMPGRRPNPITQRAHSDFPQPQAQWDQTCQPGSWEHPSEVFMPISRGAHPSFQSRANGEYVGKPQPGLGLPGPDFPGWFQPRASEFQQPWGLHQHLQGPQGPSWGSGPHNWENGFDGQAGDRKRHWQGQEQSTSSHRQEDGASKEGKKPKVRAHARRAAQAEAAAAAAPTKLEVQRAKKVRKKQARKDAAEAAADAARATANRPVPDHLRKQRGRSTTGSEASPGAGREDMEQAASRDTDMLRWLRHGQLPDWWSRPRPSVGREHQPDSKEAADGEPGRSEPNLEPEQPEQGLQHVGPESGDGGAVAPFRDECPPDQQVDLRPLLLFDLNGTLTAHTSVRKSTGKSTMRPGLHHLRRLQVRTTLHCTAPSSVPWTEFPDSTSTHYFCVFHIS